MPRRETTGRTGASPSCDATFGDQFDLWGDNLFDLWGDNLFDLWGDNLFDLWGGDLFDLWGGDHFICRSDTILVCFIIIESFFFWNHVAPAEVHVRCSELSGDGVRQLAAAVLVKLTLEDFNGIPLKELRADDLTILDLHRKGLSVPEAIVLADLLRSVTASLTSLDLSNNKMGDEGVQHICEALKQNNTLKVLYLNARITTGGEIGPQGAKYIAEMLAVNASLTELDVRGNDIKGEGASQLSAAVLASTTIEFFNKIPIKEMRAESLTELDLSGKAIGVDGAMVVAGLVPVSASLTSLNVSNNNIGDEGVQPICEALKQNTTLKVLDLNASNVNGGEIGPQGAKYIADMLAVNGSLTSIGEGGLNLEDNELGDEGWGAIIAGVCSSKVSKIASIDASFKEIGPEGAKLIAEALKASVNASLTSLDMSHNRLCGFWSEWGQQKGTYTAEGIKAVADALRVNCSLTSLNLYHNSIGAEGAKAMADALSVNGSLTSLDLRLNDLGPEGAKALAEGVSVSASLTSLTKLDVRYNRIGSEGEEALRDAVKGRNGFVVTWMSM